MLDDTGILVSSVMMLFIIFQAVRLDSIRPWFEKPGKQQPQTDESSRNTPWRRGGLAGRTPSGMTPAKNNSAVRETVPWRQRRG